jgi:pyrroline-5-carboxylate reductase
MEDRKRVAILGAGKMGEILLAGLLRSGWGASNVLVSVRRPERVRELEDRYQVEVVSSQEAARRAGTLILAVKPQDMLQLLDELAPLPPGRRPLVISIAAGLETSSIEAGLPAGTPVIRVMTNTAITVDRAMTVISGGRHAQAEHLARAEALLGPFGRMIRVEETDQDAITAIAGSGPAYFFFLVECLTEAAIDMGLTSEIASALVVETGIGSVEMLRRLGQPPEQLRANVTSPGGTTARAIQELEKRQLPASLRAAVHVARQRAQELAREYGRPPVAR